MNRCFLPSERWKAIVSLEDSEAHHLIHVLRVRPGEKLLCLDGEGRAAEATVNEVRRSAVDLALGEPRRLPEPPVRITLAVAVPGQGKLDEIVNEATQLSAARITPIITERCVVRLSGDRSRRKVDHLRQVAVEALKQSGTAWLPAVDSFTPWKEVLAVFSTHEQVLMASMEGPHEPWRELLIPRPKSILFLIGPEGGFTPQEIRQAVQAGAHCVSLGPAVLRTETACASALAALNFFLRECADAS